jgi:hypothetical protein
MVRLTKEQKEANMIEFVKDIEKFLPEIIDVKKQEPKDWDDGDTEWRVHRTCHNFFELRITCSNNK